MAIIETNTKMLETEIKLQKAFITLVHQRGFDHLSVQQLTQTAAISRGTFYLHYLDKYDLLAHYENSIVTDIADIFRRYPKPVQHAPKAADAENNAFYQLFKYLYHQRDLAALLLNEPASQMGTKVKELISSVLISATPQSADTVHDFPPAFAQEIVTKGIIDLIIFWLHQEPVLSPKAAYWIFQTSRDLTPAQLSNIVIRSHQPRA
jgi:AcrR family transcriptional regulator